MGTLQGKKILVTGASGMLAGDLLPELVSREAEILATDYLPAERHGLSLFRLDITDYQQVKDAVTEFRPHWIINCAAYTKVDDAESQRELAFLVNGSGAGNLARAAEVSGSALLHLSTDYVFGGRGSHGERRAPYREDDLPAPCGVYGASKRYGEELVLEALGENALMVRTAWLHGQHGPNFVATMLRVGKDKKELKVVNDQVGSPTWSGFLAQVLVQLIERNARGIYHVTSRGDISWFDFAAEIFSQAKMDVRVLPQSTEELGRPAPRPPYSTLDLSKIEQFLGRPCLSWKEGIAQHLRQLGLV